MATDCMTDIFKFFSKNGDNGQIVIYDAVNASTGVRRNVHKQFSNAGIQTIFVESVCTDESIIQANVRNVKVSSPDYAGWDPQSAVEDYLRRISAKIPHYEEMSREKESALSWVKMINIGERMVVNKGTSSSTGGTAGNFGYLGMVSQLPDKTSGLIVLRFSYRILFDESACETTHIVLRPCWKI